MIKKKEKRIQLLGGLIGICVAVVSLFYFFHVEKAEAGKRLHITVIGYIDDKEVNRLEKEYITDGNTLIETFSVSTKEI